MEIEPNAPQISGQDVEAKIRKIKAMKEMLDHQKIHLIMEQIDQQGLDYQLEDLESEFKNNFADKQNAGLAEKWIELWQRACAMEVILADMEKDIKQQDKNYQHILNDAGVSDSEPTQNRTDYLN